MQGFMMRELVQNAAVFRSLGSLASTAKLFQLFSQALQNGDPFRDVNDVLVDDGVHRAAVLVGGIACIEQRAYFIERHVERSRVPDEEQPLDILARVLAVVALRSARFAEQTRPLVVANGFRLTAGRQRRFTYSHLRIPTLLTLKPL